jgi:membrane protease YdiL (CAAX protease family)
VTARAPKAARARAQVQLAQRGRGRRALGDNARTSRPSGSSRSSRPSGASRLGRATAPSDGSFLPLGRGDFRASLVLVFPLLLLYQLAIVVVPSVVASDPISRLLYAAAGGRTGYLLAQVAIAAVFLGWIHTTGRTRTLSLSVIAPVVVEAAAIAALLWLALPLLIDRALGDVLGLGVGASIASALGAGIYEELIFRVLVLGAALQLLFALGLGRREAAVLAVVIAAFAFAAAHHLGAAGEPFTTAAFAFRVTAGLALGAVLWFRSLAHAVYAHALYDLLVLLTR